MHDTRGLSARFLQANLRNIGHINTDVATKGGPDTACRQVGGEQRRSGIKRNCRNQGDLFAFLSSLQLISLFGNWSLLITGAPVMKSSGQRLPRLRGIH